MECKKKKEMMTWEEFITSEEIAKEYRKTFLLNMFRKLCVRMNRDEAFKKKVRTLLRESYDKIETTRIIVLKEFDYSLDDEAAEMMSIWLTANIRKKDSRKLLSKELKMDLYRKQDGRCLACGEELGTDLSKIHIDHIIPWKLVGDELPDNYQDLCETCNECKSAQTDYIFRSMIKLI